MHKCPRVLVRIVSALSLATLGACSSQVTCDLPAQLRYTAGGGAIECGRATLADTEAVDQCVVAAFGQGFAFYAEYELPGEDSKLTLGLARDANGEVTFYQLDEDSSGGSNTGEVIDAYACSEPALDAERERTAPNVSPLTCKAFTAIGRACG